MGFHDLVLDIIFTEHGIIFTQEDFSNIVI